MTRVYTQTMIGSTNQTTLAYTWFPTRNAVRQGETRSGLLPDVFPKHITAPDRERVPCIGDYTLSAAPDNRRSNKNVLTKTAMTLDVDFKCQTEAEVEAHERHIERAVDRLLAENLEFILCSSYSNGRPKEEAPFYVGYRLCIPFAVPIAKETSLDLAKEYGALARAVSDHYALPGKLWALSQPWFIPSWPGHGPEPVYFYSPGNALDRRRFALHKGVPPSKPDYRPPADENLSLAHRVFLYKTNTPIRRTQLALEIVLDNRVPELNEVSSRHDDVVIPATAAVARLASETDTYEDAIGIFEPWIETMDDAAPRSGAGWRGEVGRALRGAMDKTSDWRRERDEGLDRELSTLIKRWSS